MPNPKYKDPDCATFMGRLIKAIRNLTDPRRTVYIETNLGFYEYGSGREIITQKIMALLYKCIGVAGLNGLDRLLTFMISTTLKHFIKIINKEIQGSNRPSLLEKYKELRNLTTIGEKNE